MTATLDSNDVAQYLADHPHFFEEHAGLLGMVKLSSPLTGKTVSLQERQMEVMRDKYKTLELHMAQLIHTAEGNATIASRFHAWTAALLRQHVPGDMPRTLADALASSFHVPQVTLRLWQVADAYQDSWFTADVSDDARIFAGSLGAPYCGGNNDFAAVNWLPEPANVQSTVILPLKDAGGTFGLLILGSPDPERFSSQMATDFLIHIGDIASAALSVLRSGK
jgi:uncharacterized protein YigA (DUF484 family)